MCNHTAVILAFFFIDCNVMVAECFLFFFFFLTILVSILRSKNIVATIYTHIKSSSAITYVIIILFINDKNGYT